MITRIFKYLSLCFFIPVHAQLVNAESKRIQNDSIRFTAIMEANFNTSSINTTKVTTYNFNFTTQFKSKDYQNYYLLFGNYEHHELNSSVVNNSSLLHFRYNRKMNKTVRLEAFTQIQNNRLLNIEIRNLYGVGSRLKFLNHKLFSIYIGNSYMFEYQKIYQTENNSFQFHRLNNYLSFHLKNPQNTIEINSITYYQPELRNFNNYRLTHETGINFKIFKNLSYTTSFNLGYDNMPPLGIKKRNYSYRNGLKLVLN